MTRYKDIKTGHEPPSRAAVMYLCRLIEYWRDLATAGSRSSCQNRFYWKCVIQPISDSTGFGGPEVHDLMKHKFLCPGSSTTELTTQEFSTYLVQCQAWAAGQGISMPDIDDFLGE